MRRIAEALILARLALFVGLSGHGLCMPSNASNPHISLSKSLLLDDNDVAVLSVKTSSSRASASKSCPEDFCKNGGTCVFSGGFPVCDCPDGFKGRRCEIVYPCLYRGFILEIEDGFKCQCIPGFTGKKCEHNVDECASSPCRNGGACTDRVNDFDCSCAPGYSGKTCDIGTFNCHLSGCLNNGYCSNSNSCVCFNQFTGEDCGTFDNCARVEKDTYTIGCKNEGICTNEINGNDIHCQCPAGIRGKLCQIKDGQSQCSEGCKNGTCDTTTGRCKEGCKYGFDPSDPRCEKDCPNDPEKIDRTHKVRCNYYRAHNLCVTDREDPDCPHTCSKC